ncbi:MAG: phosphopantetheine-binding protein, partial [Blastocatellia bacterium]
EGGIEGEIRGIWEELLGIEGIGEEESFFELGGDSLLVIQLISRIRQTFQVELPIHSFFESPTIAALAGMINKAPGTDGEDAEKIARMLEMIEQLSEEEVKALMGDA